MSTLKCNAFRNTATNDGGIDIDASGHVTLDGQQLPTGGALSNRNFVINGGMKVAQRGTVTGVEVDTYMACDRWKHFASANGQAGRCTATQETITDLAGFDKALKLQVTTTETPASNEQYGINTRLEQQDIKGLGIGTSDAAPLTLSFYAKAPTGNGVYCAGVILSGGGHYFEEVTIGTSWARHEITIPATTNSSHASTQTNDNVTGLEVQITLMAGSSTNGSTNGAWGSGTVNRATSNQSNFYSSTSNNIFVTGVQLERGAKATPFEHRTYSDELQKCLRYFVKIVGGADAFTYSGKGQGSSSVDATIPLCVPLRASPTMNSIASRSFGDQSTLYSSSAATPTALQFNSVNPHLALNCGGFSGLTNNEVSVWGPYNSTLEISAEL